MIDQINQNVGTVGWIDSLAKGGVGMLFPASRPIRLGRRYQRGNEKIGKSEIGKSEIVKYLGF